MKEFNLNKIKVDGTPASAASIAAPGSSETVLMLPFEGSNNDTTTTDRSSTGHSVTFNGDAKISTAQSKFGDSSLYLDGNDSLSFADHDDWTFGTGDFTIEFWVRFSSLTYVHLFSSVADSSGFIRLRFISASGWQFGGTTSSENFADTLSTDTWYHVAFVRTSGVVKVFRDGTQKGSDYSNTTSIDSSNGVFIGRNYSSTTSSLNGYMDGLRVTKGVARYTSNFTPPTSSDYAAAVVGSSTKHIVVDSDGTGAEEGDLKEEGDQIAKAWVNFNGTGTVAIRGAYNISSITDNGTGYYSLNFSSNMTDVNYSAVGMAHEATDSASVDASVRLYHDSYANVMQASQVRIATGSTPTGGIQSYLHQDSDAVMVTVFGN